MDKLEERLLALVLNGNLVNSSFPATDGATVLKALDEITRLKGEVEELKLERDNLVALGPDWFSWERDLKKASTHGATPISDEDLDKFRQAVADNHCKSSSAERSEARYRVQRFAEKFARGILARLDQAEARSSGKAGSDA